MKCVNCGAELRPGARFCKACGAQQPVARPLESSGPVCANCGAQLRPGARFCKACGTRQQPPPQDAFPPTSVVPPTPSTPPPQPPPDYGQPSADFVPPSSAPEAGPKRRGLWIGMGIGGLLLACACLVAVVYGATQLDLDDLVAGLPIATPGGAAVAPTPASTVDTEGTVSQEVGPEGGQVVGPGGAKVVVPENTFKEAVTIRIGEAPSPPRIPDQYLISPAGPAYEVTASRQADLGTMELVLPLERQGDADDSLYTVLYWDGEAWYDASGFVDGDTIVTRVDHFSIYRAVLGYQLTRPIGFVNNGPHHAVVRPWTFVPKYTDTPAPPPNCSTVAFAPDAPGLWPNPSRFLDLPFGTYTFCIDWTTGEDEDEDGYFDYFHYLDPRQVTLDEDDSDSMELATELDIRTDPSSPQRGRCPPSPLAAGVGGEGAVQTPPPGAGDVTVRLTWYNYDDLDLHVITPLGEEIYYDQRQGPTSGGQLDRDSNAACFDQVESPVENIFWQTDAPSGEYTVKVVYYADCDQTGPVEFRVRIMVGGSVIYEGTGSLTAVDEEWTTTFTK